MSVSGPGEVKILACAIAADGHFRMRDALLNTLVLGLRRRRRP
jgi:hypothetical protein